MAEYRTTATIQVEGESYASASCNVHAYYDEENPSEIFLDLEVLDNEDNRVELSYKFTEEAGNLNISFLRTGDPAVDYSICVAGKVASNVGQAAWECYKTTNSLRDFWNCLKTKAPSIGFNAAKALLTCLRKLISLD